MWSAMASSLNLDDAYLDNELVPRHGMTTWAKWQETKGRVFFKGFFPFFFDFFSGPVVGAFPQARVSKMIVVSPQAGHLQVLTFFPSFLAAFFPSLPFLPSFPPSFLPSCIT